MKSKRYYYLLVVLLMTALSGFAQERVIWGHVFDSQSQYPLEGVTIYNEKAGLLAIADHKGYFKFVASETDSIIHVRIAGYKSQRVLLSEHTDNLNIQLDIDVVNLNAVPVSGHFGQKQNKEIAGAIGVITSEQIARGNGASFQSAFNSIPGVKMEQSTYSEARISIRGNGVRASFGIRNIKIYVNDIPITEADGTTRIEAIDVNSIGKAEIIKGPASSLYGAGVGGVINFNLQRSGYQEQSIGLSSLVGAYGLHRLATTYKNGGDKINSYVSVGWQEYNGYREHSNDLRRFLTANFQLFPDQKRIITLLVNRTTQHAQIPGSLSAAQSEADPTQANAGNVAKAAGRYQNWTRIGLGQRYQFNSRFSNSSSIFTYYYDLDHPLAFAYLKNYYQSYGGRTRFIYDAGFEKIPTVFSVGAEFNEGLTKGTQYQNNGGVEGLLTTNTDYKNTNFSLFYQSETKISRNTQLVVGLSYNSLSYDVKNYLDASQTGIKKFDPQLSPRIAISQHINDALSLHASVSSGFSPPSSSEIRRVDGTINPAIQAEEALNYELNAKGSLLRSRLTYDLSLFKMNMKGELIGQAVQQGITIYNNAGRTSHDGAELALSYSLAENKENALIRNFKPFLAITHSDFKFVDYKKLNASNEIVDSFDGNKLTGIAPWTMMAGIDLETNIGLYLYASHYFNGRTPINDENTAYQSSYHVLNSKIGYKGKITNDLLMDLHVGVDNLLNEQYSSIIALNAVGFNSSPPAFYNPSPKRNGYIGLQISYLF